MKKIILPTLLIILLTLSACTENQSLMPTENSSSAPPQVDVFATPTEPAIQPVEDLPLQSPNQILHLRGTGPGESAPFTISASTLLNINWQQNSAGQFTLGIVSLAETDSGTSLQMINIEAAQGPSAGTSAVTLPPGEYILKVTFADAEWETWVETSQTVFPNQPGEGELIRIAGSTPGLSEAFTLSEPTQVLISWQHTSPQEFQASLEWLTTSDPALGSIPLPPLSITTEGTMPFALQPGEYQLKIELADSSWELWITLTQ